MTANHFSFSVSVGASTRRDYIGNSMSRAIPFIQHSFELGVDRLSAPILSILLIIDIGHFKNRFADNSFFFMQTNILFTGDIIYW